MAVAQKVPNQQPRTFSTKPAIGGRHFYDKPDWKTGKLAIRHVTEEGGARRSSEEKQSWTESGEQDSREPGAVVERAGKTGASTEDGRSSAVPKDWWLQTKVSTM